MTGASARAGAGRGGRERPTVDTLLAGLDRAGQRHTAPRRAVAELIAGRTGPFTAADLVAASGAGRIGIGRATIFRTLDLFASLGLVERIDLPDGGHAYLACEPAHHHHVVCVRCGRATGVEDCGMSRVAAEVARRSGYRVSSHRLEMFGTCPGCQAAEKVGRRRAAS